MVDYLGGWSSEIFEFTVILGYVLRFCYKIENKVNF